MQQLAQVVQQSAAEELAGSSQEQSAQTENQRVAMSFFTLNGSDFASSSERREQKSTGANLRTIKNIDVDSDFVLENVVNADESMSYSMIQIPLISWRGDLCHHATLHHIT